MIKRPTTLDEALSLKHRFGLGATFLAGGTDLVVGVRKGKRRVETLIDLSRLDELRTLSREGDRLRIGAMCTHTQLEASGITALAEASETVGGTQIRNLGTLGGQLGTASPAGDVSVALIALCAEVELLSVRGARSLPLADFFVGPGRTVLGPDEIVCAVSVPTDRRSAFYKLGKRDAVAISLVMAAASAGPSGDVAIGLGCVAPVPLRARRAEAHLATHGLSAASIDAAAAIVADDVKPITDHRGSADYRRAMAATLTRRILVSLAESVRVTHREAPMPDPSLPDSEGFSLEFTLNGRPVSTVVAAHETLFDTLRERLRLTGTKGACLEGECGSCTVLLDGAPVTACLVVSAQVHGREVITVEGLADGAQLSALQSAFVRAGAVQCGYCTPGLLVAATALLRDRPDPTEAEVRRGLAGNLCRCTGYNRIVDAVLDAARTAEGEADAAPRAAGERA